MPFQFLLMFYPPIPDIGLGAIAMGHLLPSMSQCLPIIYLQPKTVLWSYRQFPTQHFHLDFSTTHEIQYNQNEPMI